MAFTLHCTLPLRAERHKLLFCIAFAEYCTFALLSFFTSALVGGPVEYFDAFEGAMALAESGVFLPLAARLDEFVADIGSFSVLYGSQFDFGEAYLAYHRSRGVSYGDLAFVGCLRSVSSSGDVLDIPAHKTTTLKRTVNDVQIKKCVRVVSAVFKPGTKRGWRRQLMLLVQCLNRSLILQT